jgi:hypothetical protein
MICLFPTSQILMRRNLFPLARVENVTVHVQDTLDLFLSRSEFVPPGVSRYARGLVLGLVFGFPFSFRRWQKARHRLLRGGWQRL